ncbi:hypothetical protein Q604_UNBC05965G0001, partial [human gut metagenome]
NQPSPWEGFDNCESNKTLTIQANICVHHKT